MESFPWIRQHDTMQCGIACLRMVLEYFGKEYTMEELDRRCSATTEGVSMLSIARATEELGLRTVSSRFPVKDLSEVPLPCILHWNQNHFVVLYKVKKGRKFYVADPGKGLLTYSAEEFKRHWISTSSQGEEKGVAMFFEPTPAFYEQKSTEKAETKRSFRFLFGYIRQYRKYFFQIVLGLLLTCVLQFVFPFLTQAIVDVGIKTQDVGFIWLILIGQLMLVFSQTAVDFIRRWLLLHISMRINISLVSDFFIKLLKLPMSFFDTKLLAT